MDAGGKAPEPQARVWRNARLATLAPEQAGLGIVERGALATRDGKITYAGPEHELSAAAMAGAEIVECEGRWITPGLIDCHTHLVHAGNRANEFEMRLVGATYEEVARAGGGIVSSVKSLRTATQDQLVAQSLPRLDALIAEGVTTIEVKSGYGLDAANEKLADANVELNSANERLTAAVQLAREQNSLALETLNFVVFQVDSELRKVPGAGEVRRALLNGVLQRVKKVSDQYQSRSAIDRHSAVALT